MPHNGPYGARDAAKAAVIDFEGARRAAREADERFRLIEARRDAEMAAAGSTEPRDPDNDIRA